MLNPKQSTDMAKECNAEAVNVNDKQGNYHEHVERVSSNLLGSF